MSLFQEKRTGEDRRATEGEAEARRVERRSGERRQIEMAEISFIEWASQFASYKKQSGGIK
ncbi:hypothetical protein DFR40_0746 [Azonexus fungiphilus]|jgi:hypothetical protein|uniref:Uncharacterized protein n=1 Tax=Azonexus fungiphilus TaxID=146940 RepID=A0A495WHA3_9RHOO|nr:hypothetical protein [Azonexus fungiphilus]NHC05797.1 hypothetical protein [Azonexus fungiphilus]RKT60607.1 hypothetical protein DFR40_0746 [Azonexus fungiphilus]